MWHKIKIEQLCKISTKLLDCMNKTVPSFLQILDSKYKNINYFHGFKNNRKKSVKEHTALMPSVKLDIMDRKSAKSFISCSCSRTQLNAIYIFSFLIKHVQFNYSIYL